MMEQIKQDLQKMTHGEDWTNFDDREHSKVVYEYDRLTESTCAIIAECQTVEMAQFIADYPERLRYLIGEVERLQEHIDLQTEPASEVAQFWVDACAEKDKHIEELRKALEPYAYGTIYSNDGGKLARQALERSNP